MANIYYPSQSLILQRNTSGSSYTELILSVYPPNVFFFDASGSLTASTNLTASYVATASNSISASYALTASYALNASVVSLSASYISSSAIFDTTTYNLTASNSLTASSIVSTATASFANTAAFAEIWGETEIYDGFAYDSFQDYPLGPITTLNRGVGWGNQIGICTSCSIISVALANGVTEKRLHIPGGGEIVRPLPWGTKWARQQLWWLGTLSPQLTASGTASYGGSGVESNAFWGFCSGSTNTVSSVSCSIFMGVYVSTDNGFRQYIVTNQISFGESQSVVQFPLLNTATKYYNTIANTSTTAGTGHIVNSTPTFASAMAVDILRPTNLNGTYTITFMGPNAAKAAYDVGMSTAKNTISYYGILSSPPIFFNSSENASPTWNETITGSLTSVNIYNQSLKITGSTTMSLDLRGILVCKYY